MFTFGAFALQILFLFTLLFLRNHRVQAAVDLPEIGRFYRFQERVHQMLDKGRVEFRVRNGDGRQASVQRIQ